MKEINQQFLTGERALFQEKDSHISYCTFADGESPLKESSDLEIENTLFRWKYPLWYSRNEGLHLVRYGKSGDLVYGEHFRQRYYY